MAPTPKEVEALRRLLGPIVVGFGQVLDSLKSHALDWVTAETTQMWIIKDFEKLEGEVVGSGQCPAICQSHGGMPHSSQWIEGPKVKGKTDLPSGTAIATFINGKYPSKSHGNHVAIYISQDAKGITVFDQWVGRPAGYRVILFKKGSGDPSNDGDAFSVILTSKPVTPPKQGK